MKLICFGLGVACGVVAATLVPTMIIVWSDPEVEL